MLLSTRHLFISGWMFRVNIWAQIIILIVRMSMRSLFLICLLTSVITADQETNSNSSVTESQNSSEANETVSSTPAFSISDNETISLNTTLEEENFNLTLPSKPSSRNDVLEVLLEQKDFLTTQLKDILKTEDLILKDGSSLNLLLLLGMALVLIPTVFGLVCFYYHFYKRLNRYDFVLKSYQTSLLA